MRALRFVYSDKITSHEALLRRVGSMSILENRRTLEDMLLTVNNIIQGRAPSSFKDLLENTPKKIRPGADWLKIVFL